MTMIFRYGAIAIAHGRPSHASAIEQQGRATLPLADWRALAGRGDGTHRTTGVVIAADTGPAELADLIEAPMIVVRLAKFTDGRAYSIARILRETYGYAGEMRATGDVLLDQIALLQRAGFDSFDIEHQPTIDALVRGHLPAIGAAYQDLPRAGTAIRPTLRRAAIASTTNHSNEKRP